MRDRFDDLRSIRAIDELASAPPRRMFALSPNDALVQIALPLVLILAIIVRLLVFGQTVGAAERGPVILEMWKQQLILRIDRVLDDWEREIELPAFPDPERIRWSGDLPDDERFQTLSRESRALDEIGSLGVELYHQALQYNPPEVADGEEGSGSYFLELYDPEAPSSTINPEEIPPEFVITPERRAYALRHIEDRLNKARGQVESLQWSVVAEMASRLPMEVDEDPAVVAAAQLRRINVLLEEAGYPLLRRVQQEYEVP